MDRLEIDLISIVVPTFKECENLRPLISEIHEVMVRTHVRYEVIIVDDYSQDGTERVICELRAEGHPVRLITRVKERGLSTAVIHGFKEVKGEIFLTDPQKT